MPQRRSDTYEVDVTLRDGSTVHLRPITPEDDDAMLDLFGRLSPRTVYLRFHHRVKEMTREELRRYTHLDPENAFALVAVHTPHPSDTQNEDRLIGVARYYRLPDDRERAEVAFTVEDMHQGLGIATHLLFALAVAALDQGITKFEADVLGENRAMIEVFADAGYQLTSSWKYGTVHPSFDIRDTEAVEAAWRQRTR